MIEASLHASLMLPSKKSQFFLKLTTKVVVANADRQSLSSFFLPYTEDSSTQILNFDS